MGSRTPLALIEAISSSMFPSSLRAWWGLGSILPKGTIRMRGPETRDDIRSTKWSSCRMGMLAGGPDLLFFATLDDLLSVSRVLEGPGCRGCGGWGWPPFWPWRSFPTGRQSLRGRDKRLGWESGYGWRQRGS